MFSSQLNIKDLFSTNVRSLVRNAPSESHSERDSQLPYSQIEFHESQMPDINSQQFSSQSSESPAKRLYGRYQKGSAIGREAQSRGQAGYQHHIQQQRAKAKERDERDHLFAALNCLKECAAEVKTAVGDIRSNFEQDSKCTQDAMAQYLTNLQQTLENHNAEVIKAFTDRDDVKNKVAMLQQELAAKQSKIEHLEQAVNEYKEKQNHTILHELQKSVSISCEQTKRHIDDVCQLNNKTLASFSDKMDMHMERVTQQQKDGLDVVANQTSSSVNTLAQDVCGEVREQLSTGQQELLKLQQEIQHQLTQCQHVQREDIKALLRQQIQLLDIENEKVHQRFIEFQCQKFSQLKSASEKEMMENIKENVNQAIEIEQKNMKGFMQELLESKRNQDENEHRNLRQSIHAAIDERCKTYEMQVRNHEKNDRGSHQLLEQSSGPFTVDRRNMNNLRSLNNRKFQRRSYSDMNFASSDTECSLDDRRKSWQPSPKSQSNILQELDRQDLRKSTLPRSRSQTDIHRAYLSDINDVDLKSQLDRDWEIKKHACGNFSEWKSERNWDNDNDDDFSANLRSRVLENNTFQNSTRDASRETMNYKMPARPLNLHRPANVPATANSQFISPLLRNGKWTSKQLFSKFNPSPSPVATVRPQVKSIVKPDSSSSETTRNPPITQTAYPAAYNSRENNWQQNLVPEKDDLSLTRGRVTRSSAQEKRKATAELENAPDTKTTQSRPKKGKKRKGRRRAASKSKKRSVQRDMSPAEGKEEYTQDTDTQRKCVSQDEDEESEYISNRFQTLDQDSGPVKQSEYKANEASRTYPLNLQAKQQCARSTQSSLRIGNTTALARSVEPVHPRKTSGFNSINIYDFSDEPPANKLSKTEGEPYPRENISMYTNNIESGKTSKATQRSEVLWNQMKVQSSMNNNALYSPSISNGSESQDEDLSSIGSSPSFNVADVVLKRGRNIDENTKPQFSRRSRDYQRDLLDSPNMNANANVQRCQSGRIGQGSVPSSRSTGPTFTERK